MSWRCCVDWLLRLAAIAVSRAALDVTASVRHTALRTAVVSRRKASAWTSLRAAGSARRLWSGPQPGSGAHVRGALERSTRVLARAMLQVCMRPDCCNVCRHRVTS